MVRLTSRLGRVNSVRRDRPLTVDELAHYVPSVLGDDKHSSRSQRSGKDTVLTHPIIIRYPMTICAPGATIFVIDRVKSACAG